MKKNKVWIALAIVSVCALLLFAVFGILSCEVFIDESPNGEYQIVSWWIDKGAFGYSGAFYIKEKGLLSKWHKIGTVPFSSEWLSETEFSIYDPYPVGGDNRKEYHVNQFLNQ